MIKLYPWQDELWQRWVELRARQPHALLLKGPQGVGKLDFALNIARSVLCEKPLADGLACENCPSCHWFQQETHPDFRLIQPDALSTSDEDTDGEEKIEGKKPGKKPAKRILIEQIRTLSDFFGLSSHQGGYRVVLIHPAETMNTNAANALLKMLEEPSGQMLLILVSHKPHHLFIGQQQRFKQQPRVQWMQGFASGRDEFFLIAQQSMHINFVSHLIN